MYNIKVCRTVTVTKEKKTAGWFSLKAQEGKELSSSRPRDESFITQYFQGHRKGLHNKSLKAAS